MAGGELICGGAMASTAELNTSKPTVHRLTNRRHGEKEGATADSPRVSSAVEREQDGCRARRGGRRLELDGGGGATSSDWGSGLR